MRGTYSDEEPGPEGALLWAIFNLNGPMVSDPDYEAKEKLRVNLRGLGERAKERAQAKRERRWKRNLTRS